MQNVRIDLVEENPLSDHSHVVVRHRRSRLVEKARSFQVPGLDLEGIETAIAVGVEPFAKGIAGIGQWRVVWPAAAIGIDTTGLLGYQFKKDERPVRREDNLEWLNAGHLPRHAAGDTPIADVVALAAVGLVLEAGLMDGGIFGLERRLLPAARWLAGVVPGRTAIRHTSPLARPIRVFAEVDDLRQRAGRPQGSGEGNGADRSRVLHEVLPSPARTQSRVRPSSRSEITTRHHSRHWTPLWPTGRLSRQNFVFAHRDTRRFCPRRRTHQAQRQGKAERKMRDQTSVPPVQAKPSPRAISETSPSRLRLASRLRKFAFFGVI